MDEPVAELEAAFYDYNHAVDRLRAAERAVGDPETRRQAHIRVYERLIAEARADG